MKISDRGVLEIAEHEGVVPAPYLDSVNTWTFGVGHTAAAGSPNPEAMPRGMPQDIDGAVLRALSLFDKDLDGYEARVSRVFAGVKLKPHQFDALVSWDFNTGGVTWKHPSTGKPCQLVQEILRGDMSGDGFMGWLRPPEIRRRREAEQALFRTGKYEANGGRIPIWKVDESGQRRGILKTVSGAELRAMMAQAGASHAPSVGPNIIATIINFLKALFGGAK
ncbi:lysozyme [Marinibacterium profundimaris]|uniref:Lysozyme n=1 Tax=Marinibacterium profundimaris TaxID=1679460 RepID=A0A225NRW2_9RHOB|nr:lysozyme [Marinibacterium profundimaris]OWU77592.1 hypothetical protein ATO3_02575 [Marinibacterium profundimaris]